MTGKPLAKRVIPDSGPAARQPVGTEELIEGKLIVVADDEVVFHIERGNGIAERGIEGVHFLADVRRLIQRLAVGVGGGELKAAAGVARAEFERVVVGVANVGLERIAAEVGAQRPARSVHLAAGNRIVDRVLAAWRRRSAFPAALRSAG